MAQMTVLEIAKEFCKRQGLPAPSTVVSAQDDTMRQIHGLLNEGIEDLSNRFKWQQLLTKATFQHAGGLNYLAYDLGANLPYYRGFQQDTLWDTTSRLRVRGPLSADEWNQLTTMLVAQALYAFRLQGNSLYIFGVPDPLSSVTFSFEYLSSAGVYNPVTLAFEESYVQDVSVPRLPSSIILADIKWRWKANKGLPYAEDQRMCESLIYNLIGREPLRPLTLDQTCDSALPTLYVAAGNLPL